jgi:fatty acid desaturase
MFWNFFRIRGRFFTFPMLQAIAVAALFAEGWSLIAALLALLAANVAFDDMIPEEHAIDVSSAETFHMSVLAGSTLLYFAILVAFGLFLIRGTATWLDTIVAVALVGGHLGVTATTMGHELFHRTQDRLSLAVGRFFLAACLHSAVAIEHVYGHHNTVGTTVDPATAPRGMGYWRFLLRAIFGNNRNAFRHEKKRLSRQGKQFWTVENRFLQGHTMSVFLAAMFAGLCGVRGFVAYICVAVLGLLFVEAANYVAHYGLVRLPNEPICARHSWSSYRFVSTSTLYNISRHADHHLQAGRGYWRLEYRNDGPIYPYGSSVMAVLAFFPTLWFRVIAPAVADWDERFATPEERALAKSEFERTLV